MPIYSSSDSDGETTQLSRTRHSGRLFGRQRPLHAVLGGGKVADVLLWRKKSVSASILMGVAAIWFLFEVVEYNFVTLFCHLSMTTILVIFIWSRASEFFDWNRPKIPEIILQESTFREVALTFRARFNQVLSKLLDVACGKDPALFILTVIFLYILSVIGTYFSFLNLLFLGFVCMGTVPFLYDRYEDDVDRLVGKGFRQMKKMFRRFDSQVLNKIPRGPVKDKKIR